MFRRGAATLLLLLLVAAFAAPWTKIARDNADGAGMLAHLHGHFVTADLLYDDDYRALQMTPTFAFVTPSGVVSNHWPTGATWLQSPGYGLGIVSARVLEAVGVGSASALGVVPLLGLRAWAMVVLAIAAGVLIRLFGRHKESAGALAAWAFIMGTPLYHYAAEEPLRPHLWGFAVTLAVVCLWRRRDLGEGYPRIVLLAGLCGLAAAVRPQLAVLFLLVLEDLWGESDGRMRRLFVAAGVFSLWPLLNLRLGVWMYGGGLTDYARPASHHLRAFLLSPHHGALVWCPVLIIGGVALVAAIRGRQRGAWLLAAIIVHQIWLDASMRDIGLFEVLGTRTWAGGNGFGPRKLVDVLPLFVPAALYLCDAARRRGFGRALAAVVLAATVPTTLLHLAAFTTPRLVIGSTLDATGLELAFAAAFDPARWTAALDQRWLPIAVPLVVAAVVALPTFIAWLRMRRGVAMLARPQAVLLGAVATTAGALLANLWLTVLLVRSDAALIEDPARMMTAEEALHPAHRAAVERIGAHHARMRAVLGEHAAPPLPSGSDGR